MFIGPFPCCVKVPAVSTLDFTDRTSPCASTKDLERDRGVDKKGIKKGSKQALNQPQDGPQIFTGSVDRGAKQQRNSSETAAKQQSTFAHGTTSTKKPLNPSYQVEGFNTDPIVK